MSYNDLIVLASGKDCIAHHNRTASKLGIPEEKIPNEPPKTISTTENYPDYSRINKTVQEFSQTEKKGRKTNDTQIRENVTG